MKEEKGRLDFTNRDFRRSIHKSNPKLHSKIFTHPRYRTYKEFVDLRDIVLHKFQLYVIPVLIEFKRHGPKAPIKLFVPKNPEYFQLSSGEVQRSLSTNQNRISMAKFGKWTFIIHLEADNVVKEDFWEPNEFCTFCLDFVRDIVEKVSNHILTELN